MLLLHGLNKNAILCRRAQKITDILLMVTSSDFCKGMDLKYSDRFFKDNPNFEINKVFFIFFGSLNPAKFKATGSKKVF